MSRPPLPGHCNVNDGDIDLVGAHEVQGLLAVCRFRHDCHVGPLGDDLPQSLADDAVVVRNEYPDHARPPTAGSGTVTTIVVPRPG